MFEKQKLTRMGRSALIGGHGSTSSSSSSSSIGHETNNNNNNYHFNSRDLTTDLNLGLTISPASQSHQQHHDFINPASFFPRDNELMQSSASDHNYSTINPYNQMVGAGEGSDQQQYDQKYSNSNSNGNSRLYVKVYMEGHPIGRKLDMLAHSGYHDLITTLDHMFNTNILWGAEVDAEKCEEFHVLTYEDEEGDWLMVGDVPWEMFLSAVKRLKISRACPC